MTREPTLFSYVVDHDNGFAPNPFNGYCTLVHCKFGGTAGRRNIVELAEVGDWVIGTGGVGKDSAGHGRIVYMMRVDEKSPFRNYLSDVRFRERSDCRDFGQSNEYALVSRRFFYFGRNALSVSDLPVALATDIAKLGPGYRRDYSPERLRALVVWFAKSYKNGLHGDPCGSERKTLQLRPAVCGG
jgi:hypothetical protein